MQNYEGLPIKKYLTIGSYPYYQTKSGDATIFSLGIVRDIEVICFEQDIECKYNKEDEYKVSFVHKNIIIECYLADKQEGLKILFQEFKKPCPELLYIILMGNLQFPSAKWEKELKILYQLKSMFKITDKTLCFIDTYKQSLKLQKLDIKDKPYKRVIEYICKDSLYNMVAYKQVPMRMKLRKNINETIYYLELWDRLNKEDKIICILEEAYVLALERHILPQMFEGSPGLSEYAAFKWALMKIAINSKVSWYKEFTFENYYEIKDYMIQYIKLFLKRYDEYTRYKEDWLPSRIST